MIPFFSRMFPSTNLQDLNLDWICRRIMELSKGIIAPWINSANQHWMVYDTVAETFVDSGVSAAGEGTGPQGEPGKSPIIGSNGNWYVYDDDTEAYVDTGVNAEGVDTSSDIAFVIRGDAASTTIPVNRYVIIRNHSSIADGLYFTTQAIPSGTTVTADMVTLCANGGLNQTAPVVLGGTGATDAATARLNLELSGAKSGMFQIPANKTGTINFPSGRSSFVMFSIGTAAARQAAYIVGKRSGESITPEYTTILAATDITLTPGPGTLSITNGTAGALYFIYFSGDTYLLPEIEIQT